MFLFLSKNATFFKNMKIITLKVAKMTKNALKKLKRQKMQKNAK